MIAICVGHSRMGDMGALSVTGVSEWHFNADLAKRVKRRLQELGHDAMVISKIPRPTYGGAMEWLREQLAIAGAVCAVELHFNSSDDPSAHGHEWLHWHASGRGRSLAKALQNRMLDKVPGTKSRGLVPVEPAGRGAGFLRLTPCPAVVAEPYFGSNRKEWTFFDSEREILAEVIALGISDWMGGVQP